MSQQAFESQATTDVIAIYDQNYNQLFQQARIMQMSPVRPVKTMDHPLELGAITTDHIILEQDQIEIKMVLVGIGFEDVYENIIQARKKAQLLFITSRASSYKNHIIIDVSHEESAEIYDGIFITLKTKEVRFVTAQVSQKVNAPAKKSDTKTKDRSTIQPTDADPSKNGPAKSVLGQTVDAVRKRFG